MARLSIRLFGSFQVVLDGNPVVGFESDKARALLAYLVVEADCPQRREKLAGLLWPDRPERVARANLRRVLTNLRHVLRDREATPPSLCISHQTVQFNRASDVGVDAIAFIDALAAQAAPEQNISRLEEAIEWYRGDLLAGFSFGDSVAFEEWLLLQRERFHRQAVDALHRLAVYHEGLGEYECALRYVRRQVELDAWQERGHRQVMRLLARCGQREAALAQYETCCRLMDELGVEPAEETRRLHEQIRNGSFVAHPPRPAHASLPAPQLAIPLDDTARIVRPVFVARQRQMAQLDRFLDAARAGRGRVVFVTGEAGQGKTALIQEFVYRAQDRYPDLIAAFGSGDAHIGIGDPYHLFRQVLGLLTGDVAAARRMRAMSGEQTRRLWQLLPPAVQALLEGGPDLLDTFVPAAALLTRAVACAPGGADWLTRLEQLVERRVVTLTHPYLPQTAMFDQVTRVLRSLARCAPLVLMLDDLQWADAGSVSLLFHLGRHIADSRVFILGAYRPAEVVRDLSTDWRPSERHPLESVVNEFQRDWGDTLVELREDEIEGRQFVEAFLDTEPNRLSASFRESLYRQTGGCPLFTIELLRGMQERGDLAQDALARWIEGPRLDWEHLPARVEAVIAERIGRLPKRLREVLRIASVEGETFTAEVVARARAGDAQEVIRLLSGELDRRYQLITAHGLQRVDGERLSVYRFRHSLFQKYLYQGLDPVERAHLHEAVAVALEALHRERLDEIAVHLARHFQEAAITEKAVYYLHQAGRQAARMLAHAEAVAHVSHGLELLNTLPDTPQRAQSELMLRLDLAVPLQVVRGYGDAEVGRLYARMRDLCRHMQEPPPQLFAVLWYLVTFHLSHAEYERACGVGEQLLDLAGRSGEPAHRALGHLARGWPLIYLGQLAQARSHCDQAVALYAALPDHASFLPPAPDIRVIALLNSSFVTWLMGYPEQARRRCGQALTLAEALPHPVTLVLAQAWAGVFYILGRDPKAAAQLGEACIRLSTELGLRQWLAAGLFCRACALAEQGQIGEAVELLRRDTSAAYLEEMAMAQTLRLAVLADVYQKSGQTDQGFVALDRAEAIVQRTGERFVESEIYRLRGELIIASRTPGAVVEAERCFTRAIGVARQQSARSLELRASLSLSRLLRNQNRRDEARQRLAEVYGWFTEGFDTVDLKQARALLDEML